MRSRARKPVDFYSDLKSDLFTWPEQWMTCPRVMIGFIKIIPWWDRERRVAKEQLEKRGIFKEELYKTN